MTARMTTVAKESDYYTVPEAARLLKVSPSTIWRWIDAGKMPAYRVGPRNIRIRKEHLASVMKAVRARGAGMDKEREDIWAGYEPEEVKKAIAETSGSWADLDTQELIAGLYRAREEGSRTSSRP